MESDLTYKFIKYKKKYEDLKNRQLGGASAEGNEEIRILSQFEIENLNEEELNYFISIQEKYLFEKKNELHDIRKQIHRLFHAQDPEWKTISHNYTRLSQKWKIEDIESNLKLLNAYKRRRELKREIQIREHQRAERIRIIEEEKARNQRETGIFETNYERHIRQEKERRRVEAEERQERRRVESEERAENRRRYGIYETNDERRRRLDNETEEREENQRRYGIYETNDEKRRRLVRTMRKDTPDIDWNDIDWYGPSGNT